MRTFLFEEFLKKDPDEITFERPDSGSGGANDSDQDSDDDYQEGDEEDQYSDEEDKKLMEELKNMKTGGGKRPPQAQDTKSKTNKSRAGSKRSGGSNKTHKTNKTSKSRKSSKSGISRSKYQRLSF
jgi:hypothetical protein